MKAQHTLNQYRRWRATPVGIAPALAFVFTASLFFSPTVYAGRYELTEGQGLEVCETYKKNLNSFNPVEPMLCDRTVNPDFEEFQSPEWEELTLDQIAVVNTDIVDLFMSKVSSGNDLSDAQKAERVSKTKEQLAMSFNESWPISMKRGRTDIDNNGREEWIAKEVHGKCKSAPPLPAVLLKPISEDALDTNLVRIIKNLGYKTLTKQSSTSNSNATSTTARVSRGRIFPGAFKYKGEWYLDVWAIGADSLGLADGRLSVLVHRNGVIREVCEYRFYGTGT